jgi:hypothetical protein
MVHSHVATSLTRVTAHATAPQNKKAPPLSDIQERGAIQALERQLAEVRRQNTRLRAAMLHDCHICRIAWCPEREKLVDRAMGRQRQTLRTR